MRKIFFGILAVVVAVACCSSVWAAEYFEIDGVFYRTDRIIGRCTTAFQATKKNRIVNMRLAAKAFNGLIVFPGEVVSYNSVVGPRTAERGYKEAGGFDKGKNVSTVGGGICQVASTLAGAIINSKLKVLEKYRHSNPVSYISRELEATVVYGKKDFRFCNDSKDVIYIKSFIKENLLFIEVWKLQMYYS